MQSKPNPKDHSDFESGPGTFPVHLPKIWRKRADSNRIRFPERSVFKTAKISQSFLFSVIYKTLNSNVDRGRPIPIYSRNPVRDYFQHEYLYNIQSLQV